MGGSARCQPLAHSEPRTVPLTDGEPVNRHIRGPPGHPLSGDGEPEERSEEWPGVQMFTGNSSTGPTPNRHLDRL
ncbi:hypothetical protein D4764_12G0011750 [Takifugu flavidus]|uniref:Uncharacterized protein n=1 Tax=Takifugu flavidus TaxID=433684 RepID=A0A5C6MDJ1_9TELE|nr:hypothetical protein D4764_0249160 [Takifugu flavidus]TWW77785.1 hypothetical protein D4764_12G0011750 [Takifugu flavidus]